MAENKYKCTFPGCCDTGYYTEGVVVKKCPLCNTGTNKAVLSEEKFEEKLESTQIPEHFRDIYFDEDKIIKDGNIEEFIKGSQTFKNYLFSLRTVYNKINTGEKLNKSLFISAPQGLGKTHFVYSCINATLRYGNTAAPYLDSKELYEKIKKGVDVSEVENSDICFIKIPTGLVTLHDTQTIKLLTDRRARKSLPTIVLSRFPVNFLYSIEINLDRFIVQNKYENMGRDYSRLYVVNCQQPDLKDYNDKYMKRRKK